MTDRTLAGVAARLRPRAARRSRWCEQARPEQLPPEGEWSVFVAMAGRGWGKTRTGAEWILEQGLAFPGTTWAVVAPTFGAARDICAEGPSGILKCAQDGEVLRWVRSLGEIHLAGGSRIFIRSADEPDRLRGHNLSGAWLDELAAFRYGEKLWHEALMPAVRVAPAKVVATTTPRPVPVLKALLARDDGSVIVVRGSTFDNAASLSRHALNELRTRYEGTRLGRAELGGELLEDVEGALFSLADFEANRVEESPEMDRVVIGVDPSTTAGGDLCGIVVAGVAGSGPDAHFYVIEDASIQGSPKKWANRVAAMYAKHNADRIVAESNQGGEMVEDTLRAIHANLPVRTVHAHRSKQVRAEPVAALAEQGRLHVVGMMAELEEQCCTWIPNLGRSPDRLDAMVYAVSSLAEGRRKARSVGPTRAERAAERIHQPATSAVGMRNDPLVVGPARRAWP